MLSIFPVLPSYEWPIDPIGGSVTFVFDKAVSDDGDGMIDFVVGDGDGWGDSPDIAGHDLDEEATAPTGGSDAGRRFRVGLQACAIGDKLDPEQQPSTANVADYLRVIQQVGQCRSESHALFRRGASPNVLFCEREHREADQRH